MSYKLFLDDERFPIGPDWCIVRSFDQAVACVLERGLMEFISFDHDLGAGKNGMDFAKWLGEYMLDLERFDADRFDFYVHSQNPTGAANIREYMRPLLAHLHALHDSTGLAI